MKQTLNIMPESKRFTPRDVSTKPFASRAFYVMEIWKDIKGYEGCYQVSNFGRVKSLDRNVRHWCGGEKTIKGKILKPGVNLSGYLFVSLSKNGKERTSDIHRLVIKAFISNPEDKPECNHKNGVKNDNRAENLEWVTSSENTKHAWDNGWMKLTKRNSKGVFTK